MIRPVAVGLKVCQQAVVEDKTKNVTLVNCFRELRMKKFPAECPPMLVFVNVTDGMGTCQLSVRVNVLETLDEIAHSNWQASFSGPLREYWFLVRLPPFSFPEEGRYEVALFADGEFVARNVIQLKLKENQNGQ